MEHIESEGLLQPVTREAYLQSEWEELISIIVSQRFDIESLNRLNVTDQKTEVLNYRGLIEAYEKTILSLRSSNHNNRRHDDINRPESDTLITTLFVDVDNFKKINEVIGYINADSLLWLVANRVLKSNVRNDDIVGRFGGDEFIVVLPETSLDQTKKIYNRIEDTLIKLNTSEYFNSDDFQVDENHKNIARILQILSLEGLNLSLSIGVSEGTTSHSLGFALENANKELVKIKKAKHE